MSETKTLKMLHWLWLSVIVVAADLYTKYLATTELTYADPVPVLPFFNFTLLHNTGAAFSFLAGASGWQRWFFAILAIGVSVMLVMWLARLKHHERWLGCAISLVLGGALGNLYDRMTLGYVVDFLHFYYADYHFPAFNLADSAISVGAFMIAIDIFRQPSDQNPEQDQGADARSRQPHDQPSRDHLS